MFFDFIKNMQLYVEQTNEVGTANDTIYTILSINMTRNLIQIYLTCPVNDLDSTFIPNWYRIKNRNNIFEIIFFLLLSSF